MGGKAAGLEQGSAKNATAEKASGYRIVILILCWLSAATVYYSITQISALSTLIMEDLGISKAAMGILFSSPLLTFAIFAFIGGAISDRLGPRLIISLGMSIVSISAFCRGFMGSSHIGLVLLNLLLGVGIGLALPNLPKLTAGWFPPAQRGWATSVYSTGIAIGSSMGLLLTMPVAYKIAGTWNKVFFVWGTLAAVVLSCLILKCTLISQSG